MADGETTFEDLQIPSIEPGDMVVVHCQAPKEKLWGVLLRLDGVGVVIRGLDINSVEDWIREQQSDSVGLMMPSTQYVPIHRLERIYLDEAGIGFEGFAQRYAAVCGGDVRRALVGGDPQEN